MSRTRARGIQDLRAYLQYAEHGTLDRGPSRDAFSAARHPIEDNLVSALEERGWSCRRHIGASDHRVDVGVVDPRNPARFILGIESDGTSYRSLPSARDRDRLHQRVLTDLGWELERVWSIDWLTNPGREVERIERRLRERESLD